MKNFTEYIKENKHEGHHEFSRLTDNLYTGLSMLNILLDEGYIDGPWVKEGVSYEDINRVLQEHLGMENMFNSDGDVYETIMGIFKEAEIYGHSMMRLFK